MSFEKIRYLQEKKWLDSPRLRPIRQAAVLNMIIKVFNTRYTFCRTIDRFYTTHNSAPIAFCSPFRVGVGHPLRVSWVELQMIHNHGEGLWPLLGYSKGWLKVPTKTFTFKTLLTIKTLC